MPMFLVRSSDSACHFAAYVEKQLSGGADRLSHRGTNGVNFLRPQRLIPAHLAGGEATERTAGLAARRKRAATMTAIRHGAFGQWVIAASDPIPTLIGTSIHLQGKEWSVVLATNGAEVSRCCRGRSDGDEDGMVRDRHRCLANQAPRPSNDVTQFMTRLSCSFNDPSIIVISFWSPSLASLFLLSHLIQIPLSTSLFSINLEDRQVDHGGPYCTPGSLPLETDDSAPAVACSVGRA